MSTTVKTGWLEDNNGEYFAPKTLTSQVQTHDGTLLEDKLAETYVNKEEIIDVEHGGTGATTAEEARAYLGITPANIGAAPASHNHTKSQITDFPSSMPASDVYAWAKAVSKPSYTAGEVGAAPAYTYGTDDLTAGSSELETGKLYFVYE